MSVLGTWSHDGIKLYFKSKKYRATIKATGNTSLLTGIPNSGVLCSV